MKIITTLITAAGLATLAACGGAEEENTMNDANMMMTDDLGTDMNMTTDMNMGTDMNMDMNATDMNAMDMNATDMNASDDMDTNTTDNTL